MSSPIKKYSDLLQEEQRLLQELRVHEEGIRQSIEGIKQKLKPVSNFIQTVKKFTTRSYANPLTNIGIDFSIDLLVKKILLARAGWFTKIFIPYVVKNYSSHIISKETRSRLATKIQSFFDKMFHQKDKKSEAAVTY